MLLRLASIFLYGIILHSGVFGVQHRNSSVLKRIIGGHETDIKKFPYQVMVRCRQDLVMTVCGGTLLSKTKVATAAHCVAECDVDHLEILAGTHDFQSDLRHKVHSIHIHPEYNKNKFSNDIAVVCLEYSLKEGDRIKHIKVAKREAKAGTKAVVTGWGKTENKPASMKLRYVKVTVIDKEQCHDENPLLDSGEICTDSDGIGPCQGDSGGPLVADGELIGVVGYGSKDCADTFVRMYANAVHFKKFLESTKC